MQSKNCSRSVASQRMPLLLNGWIFLAAFVPKELLENCACSGFQHLSKSPQNAHFWYPERQLRAILGSFFAPPASLVWTIRRRPFGRLKTAIESGCGTQVGQKG